VCQKVHHLVYKFCTLHKRGSRSTNVI
jgi:hypothetical protein